MHTYIHIQVLADAVRRVKASHPTTDQADKVPPSELTFPLYQHLLKKLAKKLQLNPLTEAEHVDPTSGLRKKKKVLQIRLAELMERAEEASSRER